MQFPCSDCGIINKENGNIDYSKCNSCEKLELYNSKKEKKIKNEKLKKYRKIEQKEEIDLKYESKLF